MVIQTELSEDYAQEAISPNHSEVTLTSMRQEW